MGTAEAPEQFKDQVGYAPCGLLGRLGLVLYKADVVAGWCGIKVLCPKLCPKLWLHREHHRLEMMGRTPPPPPESGR